MEVMGTEVPSHEITWSGSVAESASFNSQAAAVGIRGTTGSVGIPGAVGIIDAVRLLTLLPCRKQRTRVKGKWRVSACQWAGG